MRQKIMYKIVSLVNGKRVSYMTGDIPNEYLVEYKIDELVVPKVAGAKLFVFKSFSKAKSYAISNYEIWAVVANNPVKKKVRLDVSDSAFAFARDFWSKGAKYAPKYEIQPTPEETYVCDSLWMLRRVD